MFSKIRNERGNWSLIGLLVGLGVVMLMVCLLVLPNINGGSKSRAEKQGLVAVKKGQTIYGAARDKAKDTECGSNLRQIRETIMYQKTQQNESESLPATLDELKISKSIQCCPVSKQPYVYNPTAGTVQCTTPGHERL